MTAGALVVMVDVAEPAVLAAAKQGLQHFGTALCLQHQPGTSSSAPASAPLPRPVVGLCNLAKPPQSLKPVLQVRYRPGPFVLRDFHAAVGRLAHVAASNGTGTDTITSATAAAALQQLVGVVAQDAACVAGGRRKSVLYLTDRLSYEPEDFSGCLEVQMCRSKGVHVELVFMAAGDDGGISGGDASSAATDALAAAWQAAELAFPHLSVTVVCGASKVSFDALACTLLQHYASQPQLAVSLQFKQALVGSIYGLPLTCSAEVRPLVQAVNHALLCPCHQAPTSIAAACTTATCAISGTPLDCRQCHRDERTVVVGGHTAGVLRLSAPFNLTSLAVGSSAGTSASLNVVARIKADQANPALMFGMPLLLTAQQPGLVFKVLADGEMADVGTQQLLDLVCSSLSASQEALLATCSTDLESGKAGLFRLHYLLLPCQPSSSHPATLCAKRVASAEELLVPLLLAPGALDASGALKALPPAVVDAVTGQLSRVPQEQLHPPSLSSRCNETVEMLVRESQPMPKVPVAPAGMAPGPQAALPGPGAAAAAQPPPRSRPVEPVAQPGVRDRQAAPLAAGLTAGGAGARESGGQQRAASGRKQAAAGGSKGTAAGGGKGAAAGGGKGPLKFRHTARR